jgi:hypothetical protein
MWLVACSGKKGNPPAQGSGSVVLPVGSAAIAAPVVPTTPAPPAVSPVVTLAANTDLLRGRPLFVKLELIHPEAFSSSATPLVIAAAGSHWADAVKLEVRDAKDQVQTWPLHALVTDTDPTISIDGKTIGVLVWRLSADEVGAIAAGTYTMTALLDTNAATAANAWKGTERSTSVALRIVATPAKKPAEIEETLRLLANDAAYQGDDKLALAKIDEILAKNAKSAVALEAKADLLAATKPDEALALYEKALVLVRGKKRLQEPPVQLLRKRDALLAKP